MTAILKTQRLSPLGALSLWLIVSLPAPAQTTWSGPLEATHGIYNPLVTDVVVESGSLVSVNISGTISINCGSDVGPDGSKDCLDWACEQSDGSSLNMPRKVSGNTLGIVIVVVNDTQIPIDGGQRTFTAPNRGTLSLFINDSKTSDNRGSFGVVVSVHPPSTGDTDQDGIPDTLEDALLDYFAPTLRFDRREQYMPTDAYWYLRSSEIEGAFGDFTYCGDCDPSCDTKFHVPFYPEFFLDPLPLWSPVSRDYLCDALYYSGRREATNDPPGTNFARHINPEQEYRKGLTWAQISPRRNMGMYGHVTTVNSNSWVLQYWQFFGYNDTPLPDCEPFASDPGDHEGDWVLFELFVDPIGSIAEASPCRIQKAIWHAHGVVDIQWTRTGECTGAWQDSQGCFSVGNLSACYVLNGLSSEWGGGMPNQHPDVFVEANMHEFWPSPFWVDAYADYEDCSWEGFEWENELVAKGDGYAYIVQDVPNLGELYRPRLGTEIITHFHGRWGHDVGYEASSPPGPAQHYREGFGGSMPPWRDPALGPSTPATYVGKYRNSDSRGPAGSLGNPWESVRMAVDHTENNNDLFVYPGTYQESVTLSAPLTLHAPHGDVTIGQ